MIEKSKHHSENIIEAKIRVDKGSVKKEREKLARLINSRRPLPGFRPGHAPANIVASNYGLAEFNREVASNLVRNQVISYLIENKINPVIDPQIEINSDDDELVFTAIFTTRPTVTVGDYTKIKAKRPKAKEVKAEEVEKVINNLHEKSSFSNTQVEASGEKFKAKTQNGDRFILDSRGQKINLGKSQSGPLDDSFAKQFGVATLTGLKEKIKTNLVSENERQVEIDLETKILEELVKITSVKLPETLIELEINGMIGRLENQVQGLGGDFENYLKEQKKTREQLARDFRKNALKTLTASLALDEIAQKEALEVAAETIDANIHPEHAAQAGERDSIRLQLLRREALSFLKKQIS